MRTRNLLLIALGVAVLMFALQPAHHASAYDGGVVHCVKPGETLYRIGLMYGVPYTVIAHANGLFNPHYIRVGQCLHIPVGGHPGHWPGHCPGCCGPGGYRVVPGDTLFRIGLRFGVSPWAIAYANGLINPNYIRAGQCLRIPGL